MTDTIHPPPAAVAPSTTEETSDRRMQRLLGGLGELSDRIRSGGLDGERLLFLLGAVIAPLGMLLIFVGWYGVAGSGLVFKQLPYVVSGGLAGLGFVFVGCTLYACWWITRSIREQRERHDQLLEKQDQILDALLDIGRELSDSRRGSRPS